jgi:hypothetical protein
VLVVLDTGLEDKVSERFKAPEGGVAAA